MPKRFTKKSNRTYKRKSNKKMYRMPIPTTIQIATRRNLAQTLKFVVNQTYVYDGTKTPNGKCAFLNYRCNSIFNSSMPNSLTADEWRSQEPAIYDNLASNLKTPPATGWAEWTERFSHFFVLGSKLTYTFEPNSTGAPATLFTHISGAAAAITINSTSAEMNKLPYCNRKSVTSQLLAGINSSAGCKGSINYSAKKAHGVKDVQDNSILRGRFANSGLGTTGSAPSEQSFFYLALAPVDPNSTASMPSGVFRVKVEYVVRLVEPTETNQVQVTGTGPVPTDEGFYGPDEL